MNKQQIIEALGEIINEAKTMRGAYHFVPPKSARLRRSYERMHSHPEVAWTEGGKSYTARFDVSCSCNNVYAEGYYTRDGKKTTLTAIRNSYRRLTEAERGWTA